MTYDGRHRLFTATPPRPSSLGRMRIPLTMLAAVVAYLVWATSLSEVTARLL